MSPVSRFTKNIPSETGPNNDTQPKSPTRRKVQTFGRFLERSLALTAILSLTGYVAWIRYLDEWQSNVRNELAEWQMMHAGFAYAVDPFSKQGYKSIEMSNEDMKKALFITFTHLRNCQSTISEIQTATSVAKTDNH